eukprot:TRINITY_DN4908_c0_g1_i2.p1 TRINITY_DN4908_c0_g1~~TRINITY_DN4908_c0_g1_i2.p1  ORF type:complete len:451 (-),score=64.35 TRINITY_DN4908_c0_g1_i2:66-1418(-)
MARPVLGNGWPPPCEVRASGVGVPTEYHTYTYSQRTGTSTVQKVQLPRPEGLVQQSTPPPSQQSAPEGPSFTSRLNSSLGSSYDVGYEVGTKGIVEPIGDGILYLGSALGSGCGQLRKVGSPVGGFCAAVGLGLGKIVAFGTGVGTGIVSGLAAPIKEVGNDYIVPGAACVGDTVVSAVRPVGSGLTAGVTAAGEAADHVSDSIAHTAVALAESTNEVGAGFGSGAGAVGSGARVIGSGVVQGLHAVGSGTANTLGFADDRHSRVGQVAYGPCTGSAGAVFGPPPSDHSGGCLGGVDPFLPEARQRSAAEEDADSGGIADFLTSYLANPFGLHDDEDDFEALEQQQRLPPRAESSRSLNPFDSLSGYPQQDRQQRVYATSASLPAGAYAHGSVAAPRRLPEGYRSLPPAALRGSDGSGRYLKPVGSYISSERHTNQPAQFLSLRGIPSQY